MSIFDDMDEVVNGFFDKYCPPVCANCGEIIKTEYLYDLGRLGLWCEDCIDDSRRYNEEV